ncbi:hypothetical protein [Actinomadura sp. WMMB 499]|uniref:hypothetical protein n=1 Tax=Actinomadura sp. WMMB 499 TaxID=1219491 RepID=UPI001244D271|nr:hypothetical protein [Actinomadura sp. WMMB 499]QFG24675.1 hypothetical protein F7P10_29550 [Actinomadura sp. WMMB 499]
MAITSALRGQPDRDLAQYFALWLGQPWFVRTIAFVTARLHVDPADVEAALVASFLEELPNSDPDAPGAGEMLLRRASRRVWPEASCGLRDVAVADIDEVARLADLDAVPGEGWELEIDPPAGAAGLRAPIRITSRRQAEGERVGMLAQDLGLGEIVHRARRLGEGRPVGRLSLRRIGAAR